MSQHNLLFVCCGCSSSFESHKDLQMHIQVCFKEEENVTRPGPECGLSLLSSLAVKQKSIEVQEQGLVPAKEPHQAYVCHFKKQNNSYSLQLLDKGNGYTGKEWNTKENGFEKWRLPDSNNRGFTPPLSSATKNIIHKTPLVPLPQPHSVNKIMLQAGAPVSNDTSTSRQTQFSVNKVLVPTGIPSVNDSGSFFSKFSLKPVTRVKKKHVKGTEDQEHGTDPICDNKKAFKKFYAQKKRPNLINTIVSEAYQYPQISPNVSFVNAGLGFSCISHTSPVRIEADYPVQSVASVVPSHTVIINSKGNNTGEQDYGHALSKASGTSLDFVPHNALKPGVISQPVFRQMPHHQSLYQAAEGKRKWNEMAYDENVIASEHLEGHNCIENEEYGSHGWGSSERKDQGVEEHENDNQHLDRNRFKVSSIICQNSDQYDTDNETITNMNATDPGRRIYSSQDLEPMYDSSEIVCPEEACNKLHIFDIKRNICTDVSFLVESLHNLDSSVCSPPSLKIQAEHVLFHHGIFPFIFFGNKNEIRSQTCNSKSQNHEPHPRTCYSSENELELPLASFNRNIVSQETTVLPNTEHEYITTSLNELNKRQGEESESNTTHIVKNNEDQSKKHSILVKDACSQTTCNFENGRQIDKKSVECQTEHSVEQEVVTVCEQSVKNVKLDTSFREADGWEKLDNENGHLAGCVGDDRTCRIGALRTASVDVECIPKHRRFKVAATTPRGPKRMTTNLLTEGSVDSKGVCHSPVEENTTSLDPCNKVYINSTNTITKELGTTFDLNVNKIDSESCTMKGVVDLTSISGDCCGDQNSNNSEAQSSLSSSGLNKHSCCFVTGHNCTHLKSQLTKGTMYCPQCCTLSDNDSATVKRDPQNKMGKHPCYFATEHNCSHMKSQLTKGLMYCAQCCILSECADANVQGEPFSKVVLSEKGQRCCQDVVHTSKKEHNLSKQSLDCKKQRIEKINLADDEDTLDSARTCTDGPMFFCKKCCLVYESLWDYKQHLGEWSSCRISNSGSKTNYESSKTVNLGDLKTVAEDVIQSDEHQCTDTRRSYFAQRDTEYNIKDRSSSVQFPNAISKNEGQFCYVYYLIKNRDQKADRWTVSSRKGLDFENCCGRKRKFEPSSEHFKDESLLGKNTTTIVEADEKTMRQNSNKGDGEEQDPVNKCVSEEHVLASLKCPYGIGPCNVASNALQNSSAGMRKRKILADEFSSVCKTEDLTEIRQSSSISDSSSLTRFTTKEEGKNQNCFAASPTCTSRYTFNFPNSVNNSTDVSQEVMLMESGSVMNDSNEADKSDSRDCFSTAAISENLQPPKLFCKHFHESEHPTNEMQSLSELQKFVMENSRPSQNFWRCTTCHLLFTMKSEYIDHLVNTNCHKSIGVNSKEPSKRTLRPTGNGDKIHGDELGPKDISFRYTNDEESQTTRLVLSPIDEAQEMDNCARIEPFVKCTKCDILFTSYKEFESHNCTKSQ